MYSILVRSRSLIVPVRSSPRGLRWTVTITSAWQELVQSVPAADHRRRALQLDVQRAPVVLGGLPAAGHDRRELAAYRAVYAGEHLGPLVIFIVLPSPSQGAPGAERLALKQRLLPTGFDQLAAR